MTKPFTDLILARQTSLFRSPSPSAFLSPLFALLFLIYGSCTIITAANVSLIWIAPSFNEHRHNRLARPRIQVLAFDFSIPAKTIAPSLSCDEEIIVQSFLFVQSFVSNCSVYIFRTCSPCIILRRCHNNCPFSKNQREAV